MENRSPLRRHPVACVGVVLGLLQLWIVLQSTHTLVIWPDSLSFLHPTLAWLERGTFTHASGRGFLYPLFLRGVLAISIHPRAIVIAQLLLVVLTYAALAVAVWVLSRRDAARSTAACWTHAMIATLWLATFTLYAPGIGLAHTVMAETLFSFVLSLVLLGFIVCVAPDIPARVRSIALPLTLFASVALPIVKQPGGPLLILVPIALVVGAQRGARLKTAGWIAVSLAVAGLTLMTPEIRLQNRYDKYMSRVFGPKSMFCNSADLVVNDLAAQSQDPFSLAVADRLKPMLTPEARLAATQVGWRLNGFNGDVCTHGDTGVFIRTHFAQDMNGETRFYVRTYLAALARDPLYLVRRLTRQLGALKPFMDTEIIAGYSMSADVRTLEGSRARFRLLDTWFVSLRGDFDGIVRPLPSDWPFVLSFYQRMTAWWWLVSAVAGCIALGSLRVSAISRRLSLTFVSLLLFGAGMCGLVATVHQLDGRYVSMQVPVFVLIGYSGTLVIVDAARWLGRTSGILAQHAHAASTITSVPE